MKIICVHNNNHVVLCHSSLSQNTKKKIDAYPILLLIPITRIPLRRRWWCVIIIINQERKYSSVLDTSTSTQPPSFVMIYFCKWTHIMIITYILYLGHSYSWPESCLSSCMKWMYVKCTQCQRKKGTYYHYHRVVALLLINSNIIVRPSSPHLFLLLICLYMLLL